jgi:hypothetical protein
MFCYGLVFFGCFFTSVSSVFFYMLQVLHLNVLKVDLVLHMLLWLYTHVSSVSSVLDVCCKCFIWILKVDVGETHAAASVPS